jgi:hypothetical protein
MLSVLRIPALVGFLGGSLYIHYLNRHVHFAYRVNRTLLSVLVLCCAVVVYLCDSSALVEGGLSYKLALATWKPLFAPLLTAV